MSDVKTTIIKQAPYQNIGLHDYVKAEILKTCHTLGYQAKPEYKGKDWRSDVFVSVNGKDYAFEVQITKQSLNKTIERQEKYKRDGVIGCWLFETEPSKLKHEERQDIPVFKITNIEGQIIVSIKNRKDLPLDVFISDYLQGKIKFCSEIVIMPTQEVEVYFIVCEGFNTPPLGAIKKVLNHEANTLPKQHTLLLAAGLLIKMDCWKCGAKNHIYYIPFYSSSCNSRIRFDEMRASEKTKFHPEVIRQIKEYTQTEKGKRLQIGEIKERYSNTTGHSYLSFGCSKCDAIFGDWFIYEAEIETWYGQGIADKTTCIIENIKDIRGKIPHWCHPGDKPFCDQYGVQ